MSVHKSNDFEIKSIDSVVSLSNHARESKARVQAVMRRAFWRHNAIAYFFLLPAIVCFLLFSVYPIIDCMIVSFQSYDLVNPPTWVGLSNFAYILQDKLFLRSWINSFSFMLWGLPFFLIPIILAIIINELRWLWGDIFRFVYYLPAVIPPIVVYYLWQWMYDPGGNGLLNAILTALHLPHLLWLDSPSTVIFSMVVISAWGGTGGGILFYLAILQGIPSHLYDAAEIDGANIIQRIWFITLPQLRVLMMYMLLFTLIGSFQVFDLPFVVTGGGPMNSSTTPVYLVYVYAFRADNYGAANALSLLVFAVLLTLSILYVRVGRRATGLGRF